MNKESIKNISDNRHGLESNWDDHERIREVNEEQKLSDVIRSHRFHQIRQESELTESSNADSDSIYLLETVNAE